MNYLPSTSCGEIGKILHLILKDMLGYKTNGTFVEVGANDGKTGSFTYNLANIGWSGINCEPVPSLYRKCCENHKNNPNVINLEIAVGEQEEVVQITEANTLSTMDPETLEIYKTENWTKSYFNNSKDINVNVKPLNMILNENNITHFDLLVLDVEGYEQKVLNGFTINDYKPSMVIIEIPDQFESYIHNPSIMAKFASLRTYLETQNYKLLVNDVVDNVYVLDSLYNDLYREKYSSMVKYKQYSV